MEKRKTNENKSYLIFEALTVFFAFLAVVFYNIHFIFFISIVAAIITLIFASFKKHHFFYFHNN